MKISLVSTKTIRNEMDNINETTMGNRKRNEIDGNREGAGRVDNCVFPGGGGGVGEEATQYPKICNIFFVT